MARYHSSLYDKPRRRKRRWMRIILAFVVIGAVIASVYGYHPFHKGENEPAATLTGANIIEDATDLTVLVLPEPEPEPEIELVGYAPEGTSESNPKVDELVTEAAELLSARPSRIIDARQKLNEALSMPMSEQQRAFVKKKLSGLADKWLFSRAVLEQDKLCGSYEVKPGDKLKTIGRQLKVPYEVLMKINNIARPKALRAGETIKVISGPFHARIYRSAFTMDLYLQNTFVRSFPVVLGRPGMETPTGRWGVKSDGKVIRPTWTDPTTGKTYEAEDPDYPLGSRWIGLEGVAGAAKGRTGFAIHGTKDPEELGTARSRGCIRLYDEDVILVYDLLMPGFSQVVVEE
jgi:LysM repeat protein